FFERVPCDREVLAQLGGREAKGVEGQDRSVRRGGEREESEEQRRGAQGTNGHRSLREGRKRRTLTGLRPALPRSRFHAVTARTVGIRRPGDQSGPATRAIAPWSGQLTRRSCRGSPHASNSSARTSSTGSVPRSRCHAWLADHVRMNTRRSS